jgi:hypothetical protein
MITRDIDSTRHIRLKLRLPDSIALRLDEATIGGGKETLIRASVAAVIMGLKIRKGVPARGGAASSAVAVSVTKATLKLWQQVAGHLWSRGSVDQLVTAALYQVLTAG